MSRKQGSFTIILMVVMIICGTVAVSCLCAASIQTAQRARRLTKAANIAASASEAFYATDSNEELAVLLGAKSIDESQLVSECQDQMQMSITLNQYGTMRTAYIEIRYQSDIVYHLYCEKFTGEAAEK